MRTATLFGGITATLLVSAAVAQPSFTWIVTFPRNTDTAVYDISADGSAAVGFVAPANTLVGYRWTRTGGRVDYAAPTFPFAGTVAAGLSADGAVTVGTYTPSFTSEPRVFRSVNNGPFEGYRIPSGNNRVVRPSVSADGSVVFASAEFRSNGNLFSNQPVRYTSPTAFTLLTAPAGGDSLQYSARDAADSGQMMVGDAFDTTRGSRPYPTVWREGQGSTWLPVDESTFVGQATAVSRNGQYIAGGLYDATGPGRLAIWSDAGLNTFALPTGGEIEWTTVNPKSLTNSASIVTGELRGPNFERGGFVWTPASGIITVTEYLTSVGVVIPLGPSEVAWIAEPVISADGSALAGKISIRDTSTNQIIVNHFVATIPAPSSLLSLGAVAAIAYRRRRR
jgi:hypothetical protein